MSTLGWILAILALIAAGYLGFRAQRAEVRADIAEGKIQNIERLSKVAEDFQPARFVRADDTTITFEVPRQVQLNGQTFVDYVEHTATIGAELDVFGPFLGLQDGREVLATLPAGKAISVKIPGGLTQVPLHVEAIFVAP